MMLSPPSTHWQPASAAERHSPTSLTASRQRAASPVHEPSAPSAVATSRAPGPEGEGEAAAYEADAGLAAVADGDEAGAPPTLGAGKKGGAGARGGGKRAAAADKVKLLVEEESRVALDYEQGEIVE